MDDRKVQDKKKKRKKKQKSKEGASLETETEVQEAKINDKFKKEEESNICFLCHSPAISTKLSKCRGCLKVSQHLW